MLRYAITNRHLLSTAKSGAPSPTLGAPSLTPGAPSPTPGAPSLTRSLRQGWDQTLIALAWQWATRNIDYIQIREKDLSSDNLRELTQAIVEAVREINLTTKVLLNGPAEIAFAAGSDGIHLTASIPPSAAAEARALYAQSGHEATISHSCHSITEVLRIREESQLDPHATTNNTLILYAPVFEKLTPEGKLPGQGLEALRAAVHAAGNIPVIALGGVTEENASACLHAGAAGIAGIRLFLPD